MTDLAGQSGERRVDGGKAQQPGDELHGDDRQDGPGSTVEGPNRAEPKGAPADGCRIGEQLLEHGRDDQHGEQGDQGLAGPLVTTPAIGPAMPVQRAGAGLRRRPVRWSRFQLPSPISLRMRVLSAVAGSAMAEKLMSGLPTSAGPKK